MNRKLLYFFSLIISFYFYSGFITVNAQNHTGWYNAGIGIDLPYNFSIDVEVETRTSFDNMVTLYQYFPQFELGYKINKHFDISAAYRLVRSKEENNYFYNRNKFYTNFMSDFSIKRFTFKNRARYQIQTRQYIEDEFDKIPDKYIRDKFELKYNIKKNPIDPFISFEIFYPLNRYKINNIDEFRYCAGIDFPLAKKHSMQTSILYSKERFPKHEKSIVFSISYKFSVN